MSLRGLSCSLAARIESQPLHVDSKKPACGFEHRHLPIQAGKSYCLACVKTRKSGFQNAMGLTGLEPVTLRLSSACSNQLSYRPARRQSRRILDFRLPIFDLE